MRVVGPHVDVDEMTEELVLESPGKERDAAEAKVREDRVALSKMFQRVLDLWLGEVHFEADLRRAMRDVVAAYDVREDEARARSRRVRGTAEMKASARADPAAPRQAVLGLNLND